MMILMAAALAAQTTTGRPAGRPQGPPPMGMEQGGPGGPGGRGPGGRGGPPDPAALFARMDADHDGVVSKAEFMAFLPGPPPGGGRGMDHGGPGGRSLQGGQARR